jgi:ABC-type Fe3+/spermidine/putrescine transport system ATPase subunit
MTGLSLRGLTVERARRVVVEDVSFTAPAGRLTAVLGARGSGKTTLLAAAAGLLRLSRGTVILGSADVTGMRGARRGVSLLSPGLALDEGASVGRAWRGLAPRGAAGRVAELAAWLGMAGLEARRVASLTHGEHFVALGAARLLPMGQALLVDEAGTGLDRTDGERLVAALAALAQGGRTIVFATRDERLAQAAEHLVLLHEGRVIQAGAPASCYAEPRTAAAALLTGAANILEGVVRERRPGGYVWAANGTRFLQTATADTVQPPLGTHSRFCLRPERLALLAGRGTADNALPCQVRSVRAAGRDLAFEVDTACGPLLVNVPSWPRPSVPVGEEALVGWSAAGASCLDG